jgi:drug/metabolite transporter (DMT)-like permease
MSPPLLAAHLVVCSLFWSSSFVLIKLTGGSIPLFTLAALRGIVGFSTLALIFLALGRSIWPDRSAIKPWLIFGTTNGWLPNVLTVYAMGEIAAATGAMIQAASPIMVAVLAHALLEGERLTARRALGVIVGFCGVMLLIGPSRILEGGGALFGVLAMLGSALSYALGSTFARTVKSQAPEQLALGQQLVSAVPATALALTFDPPGGFAAALQQWPVVIAFGVIATAIPMVLYLRIIRAAGAVRAGTVGYLQPVWAAILAALVLGEWVGLSEVIAMGIVFLGVWLVNHR